MAFNDQDEGDDIDVNEEEEQNEEGQDADDDNFGNSDDDDDDDLGDWLEVLDESSGHFYYYHPISLFSTWERPSAFAKELNLEVIKLRERVVELEGRLS